MSAHRKAVPALLAVLAMAAPLATQAQAQSIWLPDTNRPSVSLEMLKPVLTEGNGDWTAATSVFFLSARIPAHENVTFIAELPFAHAGVKLSRFGGTGTETSTVYGNPYLGAEFTNRTSPLDLGVGVRLPLRKTGDMQPADGVGIIADLDRMEAYDPDLVSVRAHLGVRHREESGLFVRARGGPTVWFYRDADRNADHAEAQRSSEMMLDYAAQTGYDAGRYEIVGGLSGRTSVGTEGSWANNSFHHLGLGASVALGNIRPGILLRVPIDDDLTNFLGLGYIVGLQVTAQLR